MMGPSACSTCRAQESSKILADVLAFRASWPQVPAMPQQHAFGTERSSITPLTIQPDRPVKADHHCLRTDENIVCKLQIQHS